MNTYEEALNKALDHWRTERAKLFYNGDLSQLWRVVVAGDALERVLDGDVS